MKVGIVVFPGSNCDEDAFHVAGKVTGSGPRLPLSLQRPTEPRDWPPAPWESQPDMPVAELARSGRPAPSATAIRGG